MVAPLLGILGVGLAGAGARALLPHIENRDARIKGRYRQDILAGLGPDAGPDQVARALLEGGALEPDEFMRTGFQDHGATRDYGLDLGRIAAQGAQTRENQAHQTAMRQQFSLFEQDMANQQRDAERQLMLDQGMNPYLPAEMRQAALTVAGRLYGESWAQENGYGAQGALPGLAAGGGLGTVAAAIADVETGYLGDMEARWSARGPEIPSGRYAGERAVGPMQVMPSNLTAWGAELGYSVDGEHLAEAIALGNPEARQVYDTIVQDRLERFQAAGYTPQEIASMWHSGRPGDAGASDLATGLSTWGGEDGGDSYMSRFTNNYNRYAGAGADAAAAGAAAVEVEAAGEQYLPAISSAQAVIAGIDALPRTGLGGRFDDPDDQAAAADVQRNAMELRYQWQQEVYGDREPPPAVQEEMAAVYGDPSGPLANRERFMRLTRLQLAELQKKRAYEQTKVRVTRGEADASALRELNGGQLSSEERTAILTGRTEAAGLASGWGDG